MTDATRLQALKDLREKVKQGKRGVGLNTSSCFSTPTDMDAIEAFDGSLDAAEALHEALLPGFAWLLRRADEEDDPIYYGKFLANIWNGTGNPDSGKRHFPVWSDTPARAWLIAILSALIAMEEDQ